MNKIETEHHRLSAVQSISIIASGIIANEGTGNDVTEQGKRRWAKEIAQRSVNLFEAINAKVKAEAFETETGD